MTETPNISMIVKGLDIDWSKLAVFDDTRDPSWFKKLYQNDWTVLGRAQGKSHFVQKYFEMMMEGVRDRSLRLVSVDSHGDTLTVKFCWIGRNQRQVCEKTVEISKTLVEKKARDEITLMRVETGSEGFTLEFRLHGQYKYGGPSQYDYHRRPGPITYEGRGRLDHALDAAHYYFSKPNPMFYDEYPCNISKENPMHILVNDNILVPYTQDTLDTIAEFKLAHKEYDEDTGGYKYFIGKDVRIEILSDEAVSPYAESDEARNVEEKEEIEKMRRAVAAYDARD